MFQARERHKFLNRFPHGWPVEEFLKTYLKNKRAYARKRGYLTENTNQKQAQHDDDDEEEEEEEDRDDKEEVGHMHVDDEEDGDDDDEQEENGWSRGNQGMDSIDFDLFRKCSIIKFDLILTEFLQV